MGEKRESHGQRNMFVFIGVERMNDEFQQADRIIVGGKRKNTSCALFPGHQRYPHQNIWEKTSTQRGANEVDWTRPTVPKERPLNTHRSRSVAHGDDRTNAARKRTSEALAKYLTKLCVDMMSSCRHAQVIRAVVPSVGVARSTTRSTAWPPYHGNHAIATTQM